MRCSSLTGADGIRFHVTFVTLNARPLTRLCGAGLPCYGSYALCREPLLPLLMMAALAAVTGAGFAWLSHALNAPTLRAGLEGALTGGPSRSNDEAVIRKLAAAVLCIALQAMTFDLPLIHAHLDDHDTAHHASRTVHAHLATHRGEPVSNGLAWSADDHDRAVPVSIMAMNASTAPVVTAIMASVALPASPSIHWHPLTLVHTQGHDPPWLASLAARAPPSLLS